MELFLDTANLDEIKEVASWGILTGVTTNPSLIAKEGKDFKSVIEEIVGLVNGDISAEVIATDYKLMIEEGRKLSKIHKNIVVKIPMTIDGLKAIKVLSEEGIKINTTLIFSANQALLAAKAGTYIVSPFVGRVDDISMDGMQLIKDIRQVYDNGSIDTKILSASIRHPFHVLESAKAGADISTIPYNVFVKMAKHPLTDSGLDAFLKDAKKGNIKV